MRDIPESPEAMIQWSRVCPLLASMSFCVFYSPGQDYEVKNMIPAETNKESQCILWRNFSLLFLYVSASEVSL